MKNFLKRFALVRWASALRKRAWLSFKNNPDLLDRIEQAVFRARQKKIVIGAPTPSEEQLIQELRARVRALPPLVPTETTPGPERMWMGYKNLLREHLLTKDPRNFLTWSEIIGTMNAGLNRRNYKRLTNFSFWPEWSRRLSVPMAKNQLPHFKFAKADSAVMQQVYHLGQLKTTIGIDVEDKDLIVEFGGGFGAMCIATHGLGFKGRYVLFDWQEFLLLQEFYLKWHGVDTSNIMFVSDFADLKKITEGQRGLLIALWSISETGEGVRESLFSSANPSEFLIGYQPQVAEVNNYAYFKKFADSRPDIEWHDFHCPNLSGGDNHWLIGKAKK